MKKHLILAGVFSVARRVRQIIQHTNITSIGQPRVQQTG